MCRAIPGKVIEMVDVERQIAKVEVGGVRRNVIVGLRTGDDTPKPGDDDRWQGRRALPRAPGDVTGARDPA